MDRMYSIHESFGTQPRSVDLDTFLAHPQIKALTLSYVPQLTVVGTTVKVYITVDGNYFARYSTAFYNTTDTVTCDFPESTMPSPEQECMDHILGRRQLVKVVNSSLILADEHLSLLVLVLWEQGGRWERLALIEQFLRWETEYRYITAGAWNAEVSRTCIVVRPRHLNGIIEDAQRHLHIQISHRTYNEIATITQMYLARLLCWRPACNKAAVV
ncbi:hypothetical protein BU25DRAFT_50751 [Macroventuria anomochaeta]|uniref:Uncharacterized protein n=1 Tax=Macroventuria anomochaeta TaxID=301207 RepID=A0ACB6S0Y3_9PLEO|nr:uncharacterized protein BU25DRAFT_50751 [Macroventuria anomochaeta]KAF2627598.1 hypothetical protein BU25DRAFT_50751 [Macroventuria anomochaeta]